MKNTKLLSLAVLGVCLALAGMGRADEFDLDFGDESAGAAVKNVGPATATISGKVVFSGTPPSGDRLMMDADPICKMIHSADVLSQASEVNADGTLPHVFVYVKEGAGGDHPTPKDPVTIDQVGCMYEPHVFGVQVGQGIRIVNSDDTLHNVHAVPKDNKQFNLAMPFKGMELTKKFNTPEVMVKFKCDVHPWMNAYVGVVAHPFFAATGNSGSFTLPKLPAGTYTLEAWHETYGTQTQAVTVANNETKDITFTFK
jgi:plastocyanin